MSLRGFKAFPRRILLFSVFMTGSIYSPEFFVLLASPYPKTEGYIQETAKKTGMFLPKIIIPAGRHILPNGQFDDEEWKDAFEVKTDISVVLLFKQERDYLYLGIKFLDEMHTGVDLFLAENEGRGKKLHVSAALGESNWENNTWTDIQWGKNYLWTANSIGTIIENGERKVVPLEGFEFQISRCLLPGTSWRLFFHLKRPDKVFPAEADSNDISDWIKFEISNFQ